VTEQLHRLIDSGAAQPVINERVAGLLEGLAKVGTDHERRIRLIERTIAYALGAIGMISAMLYLISVLKK
jgi:hypothetical protein